MKKKVFWLKIAACAAVFGVVIAGMMLLQMPSAWAENGQPFLLVLLAMVGCTEAIRLLWSAAVGAERQIEKLEQKENDEKVQAVRAENVISMRKERDRREWQKWFEQQEREMRG